MSLRFIKPFERLLQSLDTNTIIYLFLGKVVLFVVTWAGMSFFEPLSSPLRSFFNYLWFYVVTITTVGYGDISPESVGGKLIGIFLIVVGIILFGSVIGFISSSVIYTLDKIKRGQMQLHESGHLIIIGYHLEKTQQLVEHLLADKHQENNALVLCHTAEQCKTNPLPKLIKTVCNSEGWLDTFQRACLPKAKRIIVDLENDLKAVELCVRINVMKNPEAHVVVALRHLPTKEDVLAMINPTFECVDSDNTSMITQACQDPGVSRLFATLLNNFYGQVAFRANIPQTFSACSFGSLLHQFKKIHNALVIATTDSHDLNPVIRENPSAESQVCGGMGLYYLASERLTQINWTMFEAS